MFQIFLILTTPLKSNCMGMKIIPLRMGASKIKRCPIWEILRAQHNSRNSNVGSKISKAEVLLWNIKKMLKILCKFIRFNIKIEADWLYHITCVLRIFTCDHAYFRLGYIELRVNQYPLGLEIWPRRVKAPCLS